MFANSFFKRFFKYAMLIPLFLAGCGVEEVSSGKLAYEIESHSSETINQLWYMGSSDGKDYFCHNTAFSQKVYAISDEGFTLDRFPLTRERKTWKLVSTRPPMPAFTNENIRILPIAQSLEDSVPTKGNTGNEETMAR